MDIDVLVFTPLAPAWHIQGHALHLYIMGDTTVPWFSPIPPIGCQGTQKVTGGTMTRHDDGDRRQDDGDGQQDDGNGQQGDSRPAMAMGGTTTATGDTTMDGTTTARGIKISRT